MINIVIPKRHNPKKKYDAVINGSKTISFWAVGYEDFTIYKDEKRKQNYVKRHSNEDWSRSNLESAGWMRRYIYYGKSLRYRKQ